MKSILLGLGLVFSMNVSASECLFGDYAESYLTQLDDRGEREFYLDEKISLYGTRLNGLNELDKKIAFEYIKNSYENDFSFNATNTADEAISLLGSADGYISYFYNFNNYNQYAQVGFTPGDNLYGAIYKIDGKTNTLKKVAGIYDGDIGDCTEFKK